MDVSLPVVDNTYGAWLLGSFACVLFQGMVFHQTYRYFKLYPRDATYLKVWVIVVNVVELVTTMMAVHTSYYYMVSHAFDVAVLLEKPVWSITWMPIPATLATISVELFFARRLWLIDYRFWPVVALAVLLNLGFFSCFTAMIILTKYELNELSSFLQYSYLASVAAGLIGISDIMVTVCLIYTLHTRRTGIKETNSKIDLLIKYAVSTGLIVCIGNLLNVIFSVAHPDNWIYIGISVAVTKLYANTFLVSLNARQSLMSANIIDLEQTTRFGGLTRSRVTHVAFNIPSCDAPTSHEARAQAGLVCADTGSIVELKQMGIEEDESGLDMVEYKCPRRRDGDTPV
ncbi:hypothetical protein K466DRAFT_666127 [Polyporus arcularius HHB13444]|uniref:DUF6534 domain-containing protein n=1 Tax=Polyporus arcularius HHB13444 TaxID=1314778 RepID=A0A5C3P169_9APHY|nr:hypothetical protein K466DRAFT_666127 [Polyporus arcularius HHB13444]